VQREPVRREPRLHGELRLGADLGRDYSPERTLAPQPIAMACTRLTPRTGACPLGLDRLGAELSRA
jgi:hypothetical protein